MVSGPTGLDRMIVLTGVDEVVKTLKEELPEAMQNTIVKNAMYRVMNTRVIPLIKEQIREQGLVRTGNMEASIMVTKAWLRDRSNVRLAVGPGILSEDKAFSLFSSYRRPYYARYLEIGTNRVSKKGNPAGIKARRFMLKSHFMIKVKYAEWMREALAEEFMKWKLKKLRKVWGKK